VGFSTVNIPIKFKSKNKDILTNLSVILSNFRRTQTEPKYFYNKTRIRGVESNHRTTIKNFELFLKTRVFLRKKP